MRLNEMCSFLESLYIELVPGMGCLPESPRIEANVCYTNTNYVAYHALQLCGSKLVTPISNFLEKYGYKSGGRFEVFWLEPIPYPPRPVKTFVLDRVKVNDKVVVIKADVPSGEPLPDWYMYADLLMLAALEMLRRGNRTRAISYRGHVLSMWDGRGFADKVYVKTRLYEMYKLSLYYFLARALRTKDEICKLIPGIVEKMTTVNGGIVTHYTNSFKPVGDPNVETTSITILALYSNYPDMFPFNTDENDKEESMLLVFLVAPLIAAILTLPIWRWQRLSRR